MHNKKFIKAAKKAKHKLEETVIWMPWNLKLRNDCADMFDKFDKMLEFISNSETDID